MRLKQIFVIGALGMALLASTASAQTQAGAIRGTVTDETTGVPLPVVTVVATSPALQGQLSEFTDGAGQYRLDSLPIGSYSILFIYGDAKVKRENVEVGIGKETIVNAKINTQATGEVITIKEKAPAIDAGSTKQGTTVQQDYMKHVPNRGRTWAGVLGAAAGSQGDAFGTSFSGSTSVENNYVVDGVNTTGVTLGAGFPTQGSQVINNFIQEIEIITGGYNAEFGRSTGGVVNVVTKTGSNEFHGSVFGNVTAFNADVKDVVTVGSSLQAKAPMPTAFDFGFELGGPIIKDKLWFYVGFAPSLTRQKITRIASTRVDRNVRFFDYDGCPNGQRNADMTCNGDFASDPNGMTTPRVGCETTGTCESDGIADLNPATNTAAFEEVERHSFTDSDNTYQFTGKVNFAITPEHQGQISLTGQATTAHNVFSVLGTPTSTQEDETGLNTDIAVKWTSKFFDNKTQIDFLAGWHRNKFAADPITDTLPNDPSKRVADTMAVGMRNRAAFPQFGNLGAFGRNSDTPEAADVLKFCTDGDPMVADAFPRIVNCPVGTGSSSYIFNSPVRLGDQIEQRYSGKLTATQRVKLAGHHQFKAGVDFESNVLDNVRGYTGGSFGRWTSSGSTPLWLVSRYVDLNPGADVCGYNEDDTPITCNYLDRLNVHGNTLNYGAFLQDSWSILPNLTVNAGLRYEQQYLRYASAIRGKMDPVTGEKYGENALALKDLLAPRLGVIYDWTKEGRSKVYASWGRFFESIPMDINDRSFGGEVTLDAYWNAATDCGTVTNTGNDATTTRLPSLPGGCPAPAATGGDQTVFGLSPIGGTSLVVPGTSAQYLDELTVGVEYEILEDLRVGVSYQNRRLGRVIEDMSVDGASTYYIGNPGEFSDSEEDKLLNEIEDLEAGGMATKDQRDAAIKSLEDYRGIRKIMDKPVRDYNAVQLTASKRFSRAFMIQGSYTYSKLRGNYPGLFSPYRNQLDPNITSQYDLLEFLANRMGDLPFDRPHQFKVDGYYTFDLQKAGRVTAGARFRAQSGFPLTPLAPHNSSYGDNESFLLPAGAFGHTDFTTGVDLHVAYGRKLGNMDLELYFELFNVMNNQYQTAVDFSYTPDPSDPIVGGEKSDLSHLKSVTTHSQVALNPNFRNTRGRAAPLSGRFGLTLSF